MNTTHLSLADQQAWARDSIEQVYIRTFIWTGGNIYSFTIYMTYQYLWLEDILHNCLSADL